MLNGKATIICLTAGKKSRHTSEYFRNQNF